MRPQRLKLQTTRRQVPEVVGEEIEGSTTTTELVIEVDHRPISRIFFSFFPDELLQVDMALSAMSLQIT